ncbi:MAG: imidazoleglycerol-phosphate dehydratase HisB [Candidatus Bathyarchaeia archaeon]
MEHSRITKETQVNVRLNLDGSGSVSISTGMAFFDHLIRTLGIHGGLDLTLSGSGNLKHHIVEDIGITLGEAFRKALGDCRGIQRFGFALVPMDDALALAAVDLVSRPYSRIDLKMCREVIEDTSSEDIVHFLESFTASLRANVHIIIESGTNNHHKAESAFKALALSLRQAVSLTGSDEIRSEKGIL